MPAKVPLSRDQASIRCRMSSNYRSGRPIVSEWRPNKAATPMDGAPGAKPEPFPGRRIGCAWSARYLPWPGTPCVFVSGAVIAQNQTDRLLALWPAMTPSRLGATRAKPAAPSNSSQHASGHCASMTSRAVSERDQPSCAELPVGEDPSRTGKYRPPAATVPRARASDAYTPRAPRLRSNALASPASPRGSSEPAGAPVNSALRLAHHLDDDDAEPPRRRERLHRL